jgi:glycolate oxidase FAD binding subunit
MRQQRYEVSGDEVLVRCGARPKETAALAMGIVAATADLGVDVPLLFASPGIGTVVARLDFGSDGSGARLAEVQTILGALAETATILAAPPAWKRGIDVWGRLPDGFEIMRAVRQEFDPERTINPGRFAGFL